MAKKKKETSTVYNIENFQGIADVETIAQAIVRAKEIEKENEKKQKEEAIKIWHKKIGFKDINIKENFPKNVIPFIVNFTKSVFKLLFFKKKDYLNVSIFGIFIQLLTVLFFKFAQFVCFVSPIVLGLFYFMQPNITVHFVDIYFFILLSLFAFFFSRIFRLIAIEVDQMESREKILGVFTVVVTVFPLIEKVIDIVKEVL